MGESDKCTVEFRKEGQQASQRSTLAKGARPVTMVQKADCDKFVDPLKRMKSISE